MAMVLMLRASKGVGVVPTAAAYTLVPSTDIDHTRNQHTKNPRDAKMLIGKDGYKHIHKIRFRKPSKQAIDTLTRTDRQINRPSARHHKKRH
ncbi:hypothetical protein N7495_008379 [Penicillium taxi]|uniref:uncharacterized protein n=1 Tax=Penicillium taxi TaxID=168475 RepID=UPI002544EFDB|nr:uncharacterized protein N7495_008379 [Penicillium taxi]KAJ5888338.1 hypothetical protein N7495_008379 [Penicillium taxi]